MNRPIRASLSLALALLLAWAARARPGPGTSADPAPLNMIDREGRETGFEAELMRSLADAVYNGVFVNHRFEGGEFAKILISGSWTRPPAPAGPAATRPTP